MAYITRTTKALLKASELVTSIKGEYQSRYKDAPTSEVYTFTCGYLESMLASIMADHPSIHKEVSARLVARASRLGANGTPGYP